MIDRIGILEKYIEEGDTSNKMYNTRMMKAHYHLAKHYIREADAPMTGEHFRQCGDFYKKIFLPGIMNYLTEMATGVPGEEYSEPHTKGFHLRWYNKYEALRKRIERKSRGAKKSQTN